MLRYILSKRRVYRVIALSLMCLCVSAGFAAAQGTGAITGAIKDSQAGALPGVSLTLRNVESGVARTTISEDNGTYRFAGLLPGRYDLTAELPGFATAELTNLTITVALELRRDITMARWPSRACRSRCMSSTLR